MTLLAVRHASLGYSRHPVLRDVSFTLSQGTICCLLGANGCGKTTLMRSILGVIPLELSNQVQRFFEVNFIRCFPT
ncbi:iron ABCtransporter ATP-binding protein [Escherichia coli]|nr:iron ABCtransporter ATP-binding protein [Escherichia coli]